MKNNLEETDQTWEHSQVKICQKIKVMELLSQI